jgi:transcriptional regulator with PAS, ATPase and Fis domain
MGSPVPEFSYGLLKRIYAYPWPGNVRELKNTLARILINTKGQKTIDEAAWFLEPPQLEIPLVEGKEGFELEQAERNAIENALREATGNQSRAAGLLKISRPTLLRKIRKYNLFDLLESLLNSKE